MAFPNYPNPGAPRDPLAPSATKPVPRFTREELQILKQCNRESFFGRCVPLMAALGLGAYYGVHLGYLKKNPKYGATLKVGFGLLVGFIGGKVSYLHKCEEKFLSLPGGRVKESILMKRSGKDGFLPKFDDGVYNDASLSYAMPYVGSNLESGEAKSIFELDTDRPYDSFDDSFRGKSELDNENESLPQTPPSRSVTYDELRQQNRAEYDSRRKMYRSGPIDDYAPYGSSFAPPPLTSRDDERFTKIQSSTSPSPPPPPPSSAPLTPDRSTYTIPSRLPPPRKNLYGDVMEK